MSLICVKNFHALRFYRNILSQDNEDLFRNGLHGLDASEFWKDIIVLEKKCYILCTRFLEKIFISMLIVTKIKFSH